MAPSSRGENLGPEVPDGYLGLTLCCAASWEDGSVVTWGKDPVDSDGLPSLCWEFFLRSRFLQALFVCWWKSSVAVWFAANFGFFVFFQH